MVLSLYVWYFCFLVITKHLIHHKVKHMQNYNYKLVFDLNLFLIMHFLNISEILNKHVFNLSNNHKNMENMYIFIFHCFLVYLILKVWNLIIFHILAFLAIFLSWYKYLWLLLHTFTLFTNYMHYKLLLVILGQFDFVYEFFMDSFMTLKTNFVRCPFK